MRSGGRVATDRWSEGCRGVPHGHAEGKTGETGQGVGSGGGREAWIQSDVRHLSSIVLIPSWMNGTRIPVIRFRMRKQRTNGTEK